MYHCMMIDIYRHTLTKAILSVGNQADVLICIVCFIVQEESVREVAELSLLSSSTKVSTIDSSSLYVGR